VGKVSKYKQTGFTMPTESKERDFRNFSSITAVGTKQPARHLKRQLGGCGRKESTRGPDLQLVDNNDNADCQ
jgi:hypothetical protein